jgi:glutaconyl-CoA/methylmalonyl-CoA decarboxylase subunit gamma
LRVTVKVDGHDYEVEIGDLAARPIVATIDGTSYEVWPEVEHVAGNGNGAHPALAQTVTIAQPAAPARVPSPSPAPANGSGAPRNGNTANEVRAPLPGVIVSVKARPGMKVNVGDELLVLEAMKMKNAVRATRAGTVSDVAVTEGQTVKHSQVLLKYEG